MRLFIILLTAALLLVTYLNIIAQKSNLEPFERKVKIAGVAHYLNKFHHNKKGYGFGLDIDYQLSKKFSFLTRTAFTIIKEDDEEWFQIYLTPKYTIGITDKTSLSIYLGVGPTLISGYDYAAVISAFMEGIQLTFYRKHTKGIFLGINFSQGKRDINFGHLAAYIGYEF